MDLSLLIPVYNWDVTPLLAKVLAEVDQFALTERLQVLVLDDCSSDPSLRAGNEAWLGAHERPYLSYRALPENLGRAAIRNVLAGEASGEFLLFLDCDVLPDNPDFLSSYLAFAAQPACQDACQEARHPERSEGSASPAACYDVVCGGVSYRSRVLMGREYDYHAYLGSRKEAKPASLRNRAPGRFLLTSNVMVRKDVFLSTPFDRRFVGYGYEDVEWGLRLAQNHRVLHIDNPVSHLGLVTKESAYRKMRESVENYLLLREISPSAFDAAAISKWTRLFGRCGAGPLRALDRTLGRLFLAAGLGNRFAFVCFQLNFAVLLALALKDKR